VLGVRRREPSVGFLRAFEAGAAGKDDLTVLKIAAEKGCILVSHDVRTMPRYFHEFIHRQASPDLILVPKKLALSAAIEELVLLWIASESDDRSIRFIICRFDALYSSSCVCIPFSIEPKSPEEAQRLETTERLRAANGLYWRARSSASTCRYSWTPQRHVNNNLDFFALYLLSHAENVSFEPPNASVGSPVSHAFRT
jgi:hypothetical protein